MLVAAQMQPVSMLRWMTNLVAIKGPVGYQPKGAIMVNYLTGWKKLGSTELTPIQLSQKLVLLHQGISQ